MSSDKKPSMKVVDDRVRARLQVLGDQDRYLDVMRRDGLESLDSLGN